MDKLEEKALKNSITMAEFYEAETIRFTGGETFYCECGAVLKNNCEIELFSGMCRICINKAELKSI
jgi:hypothetical protein